MKHVSEEPAFSFQSRWSPGKAPGSRYVPPGRTVSDGPGKPLSPGVFIMAADFIKGFADGCHHKKEEGVLFPAMQAAGVPSEGGPISVMLAEHEQGRRLTAGMRAAAERLPACDASANGGGGQKRPQYVDPFPRDTPN